jgi:hypothetical protein
VFFLQLLRLLERPLAFDHPRMQLGDAALDMQKLIRPFWVV